MPLILVIGEFETVIDGPATFSSENLDIRRRLPDHKVKESSIIPEILIRYQGFRSPSACVCARILMLEGEGEVKGVLLRQARGQSGWGMLDEPPFSKRNL